jgi:hypothetical protein
MATSVAYDPECMTGYRHEQLAAAFDRVRDPRDWQAPIQAVIPVVERPLVEKAVVWFTNTVPEFMPAPEAPDRLLVRAPGYRLGPAGRGDVDADLWGLRGPMFGR